jgi:P4 family phage/plasmid primase-like protien
MMSKQTKLSPDFDADCPKWKETIKNATMGDEKLQDLLELTLGMSVTGYTHEIFFIFYGQTTDNLKSTICETVLELLGEYGGTITCPALTANKASGEGATPAIAGMRGKRLILADEWRENEKLDDAIVKRICSQDAITARMLHSNPITFTPTHTIILRTNSLPIVSGSDEGVWKRLRPLPFNYKVPPEKKDEGYRTRMVKEEGGAILAWLCRCAMRFIKLHESGGQLPNPESVVALKKQYRTDSDILSQWGDAELEFGSFPPYFVSNKELKDSFTGFAEDRGEEAKNTSHKAFAMFLGKHGCNPKRNRKSERGWDGVRLRIHQAETEQGDGVERTPF